MTYPESVSVNGLGSRSSTRLTTFITLKMEFWWHARANGRLVFQKTSTITHQPTSRHYKSHGLSGIYVDRRGYLGSGVDKRCVPFANDKIDRIKNNCMTIMEIEQDIVEWAIDAPLGIQRIVSKDAQPLLQHED